MSFIRLAVVGSPDDGKSTLLGRLFVDGKMLKSDQLRDLTDTKTQKINLAFVSDGLRSEREKSITIDAAYKHLRLAGQDFLIADCPGHFEFMKNAVSAVSQSQALLLLIDAELGIRDQTLRHLSLASFFGLSKTIVCVNKMDAVNFDEVVFSRIQKQLSENEIFGVKPAIEVIPISALQGENLFQASEKMKWYQGPTLLQSLIKIKSEGVKRSPKLRVFVQTSVSAPDDTQHCLVQSNGAEICMGDSLVTESGQILPPIDKIYSIDNENLASGKGRSALRLSFKEPITLKRSTILCASDSQPRLSRDFSAKILWISDKNPSSLSEKDFIRVPGREVFLKSFHWKNSSPIGLSLDLSGRHQNSLFDAAISLAEEVAVDALDPEYFSNEVTLNSFLIFSHQDFECLAVGRILENSNDAKICPDFAKVEKTGLAAELSPQACPVQ